LFLYIKGTDNQYSILPKSTPAHNDYVIGELNI